MSGRTRRRRIDVGGEKTGPSRCRRSISGRDRAVVSRSRAVLEHARGDDRHEPEQDDVKTTPGELGGDGAGIHVDRGLIVDAATTICSSSAAQQQAGAGRLLGWGASSDFGFFDMVDFLRFGTWSALAPAKRVLSSRIRRGTPPEVPLRLTSSVLRIVGPDAQVARGKPSRPGPELRRPETPRGPTAPGLRRGYLAARPRTGNRAILLLNAADRACRRRPHPKPEAARNTTTMTTSPPSTTIRTRKV